MRKIDRIILHCSATREWQDIKMETVKKWHTDKPPAGNGWKDIGYHYYIELDGKLRKGRDEKEIGAHTTGYNATSIGICYCGGCDKDMKPKDTRTIEQKVTLYNIVLDIMARYNLRFDNIYCHYQFANKACPSFKIETFKKELLDYINKQNDKVE